MCIHEAFVNHNIHHYFPENLSINNISTGGVGGSQITKIELMLFMDSPLPLLFCYYYY